MSSEPSAIPEDGSFSGLVVQRGHHGKGGGDHDRVGPRGDVGGPRPIDLFGGGVGGDGVDPVLVGPTADNVAVPGPQRQRRL